MCQYLNVQYLVTGPILSEIATHRCLLLSSAYLQLGNQVVYTIKCMWSCLVHKMSLLKFSRCVRSSNAFFILTCIQTCIYACIYQGTHIHIHIHTYLCIYQPMYLPFSMRYINTDAQHVYACICMLTSLCMYSYSTVRFQEDNYRLILIAKTFQVEGNPAR